MRVLSRTIFREVAVGALLGIVLFTFVLFLRKAGQLFAVLVHFSGPPRMMAYLFSLGFPQALIYTIPLGTLVGVLLGLSRMSADGEITAMRACGIAGRSVARPVLTFATLATLAAAASSIWLTPWAYREEFRLINTYAATEMTAEIQPRVFDEDFPKRILYLGDVEPGRWRNVFIADVTPPEERPQNMATEYGDAPRLTLARAAVPTVDIADNRLQLSLSNETNYAVEKDVQKYSISSSPSGELILEAQKPNEKHASKPSKELDTIPLYKLAYKTPGQEKQVLLEARIELHTRFALPLACLLLPLVGIPLGVSSRKGGKSGAFVLTVAVAFLYFMIMIALNGLAMHGTLPVGVAVWLPNVIFTIAGLVMMYGLEQPGDRDLVGSIRLWFAGLVLQWRNRKRAAPVRQQRPALRAFNFPLLPQLVDTYVLNSFVFYFVVLLTSFVLMIHVFTFFELISDIVRNKIAVAQVMEYLFFLTPELIYETAPLSVLVSVLITFGVFTKNNEVTAFKACGVSAYRLAVPVVVASTLLSGGLFAFDHYYVPDANRRQDALRSIIKGKAPQTYLSPNRKWIYGQSDRIYYYKGFDADENVMVGVSVFELDPKAFRLTRHIQAEKARWEPDTHTWVFQNGWSREFDGDNLGAFHDFRGQVQPFPHLTEPPNWFMREVKPYIQVNFQELADYIRDVRRSGFNTVPLEVQYHKKFSVPLFAVIMALISIPFSFVVGARGAMAGVGVSFGIAIAYLSLNKLFEQIGNLNQLPPQIAAWSPDVIFALAGLYFLTRLKT